tara:strand:- start:1022 stop:1201 length:180 start_codon:yes stop_codon:yes gene_type:complete
MTAIEFINPKDSPDTRLDVISLARSQGLPFNESPLSAKGEENAIKHLKACGILIAYTYE